MTAHEESICTADSSFSIIYYQQYVAKLQSWYCWENKELSTPQHTF